MEVIAMQMSTKRELFQPIDEFNLRHTNSQEHHTYRSCNKIKSKKQIKNNSYQLKLKRKTWNLTTYLIKWIKSKKNCKIIGVNNGRT